MEKELKTAKQFNKAAMTIIIILLMLMSFMAVNMLHLAERYERLEFNYEKLYEEWLQDSEAASNCVIVQFEEKNVTA